MGRLNRLADGARADAASLDLYSCLRAAGISRARTARGSDAAEREPGSDPVPGELRCLSRYPWSSRRRSRTGHGPVARAASMKVAKVKKIVTSGSPADAILEAAEGEGADTIVMGSRRFGKIADMLMCSVS
ncbi:MAG: universal stress protein [Alphaproteobacteria bacterium]